MWQLGRPHRGRRGGQWSSSCRSYSAQMLRTHRIDKNVMLLLLLLLPRRAVAAAPAVTTLETDFTGTCAAMLRAASSRRRPFRGRSILQIVINPIVTQLLLLQRLACGCRLLILWLEVGRTASISAHSINVLVNRPSPLRGSHRKIARLIKVIV